DPMIAAAERTIRENADASESADAGSAPAEGGDESPEATAVPPQDRTQEVRRPVAETGTEAGPAPDTDAAADSETDADPD
ncbi:hypothetical protein G3M53_37520, partial [Streptomyces sp. SID7982]|nr:hypothetical protein [Streptomyces sp. SID7982]